MPAVKRISDWPTVLVTGGAGFFGRHLVEGFRAKGHPVRSLDVLAHAFQDPGVHVIQADIRNAPAVDEAVEGCGIVIHNAAMVLITRAGREFWDVNVEGTRRILEASLRHSVGKVIFVSSSTVYGLPARSPVPPEAPLRPIDEYARSKVEAEAVCNEYRSKGLDIVIMRPQPIVGTGRLGILEVLFDRVRRNRWFPILGRGDKRFQLLGARDFLDAIWLSTIKSCRNMDFNVGTGKFTTLRGDLEEFVRRAGSRTRIVGLPRAPVRAGIAVLGALRLSPFEAWHYHMMARDIHYDTSRLRDVLGWKAQQSNADVLLEAYQWYLAHRGEPDEGASAHTKGVGSSLLGWLLKHI